MTPQQDDLRSKGKQTRDDGSLREFYQSDIYHVEAVRHLGNIMQIMIRRHDWQPVFDWRDTQAIKNQIAGTESEAIELYPAESRVVDNENWAHLWLMLGGEAFPFGFSKGERSIDPQGVTQRGPGEKSDTSRLARLPYADIRITDGERDE